MTRVVTVGTSSITDDLEKREGFLATVVGTVGTSSNSNCTYGLSDEKREQDSISCTRFWYERTRTAIKQQEGLLARSWSAKKREDGIFYLHSY